MMLDESDLRDGLKFIVGTWQVDFIVNAWSNDLAHIPASEWKSDDGSDFSQITFEFFEDHTVKMTDTSKGREVEGTWEQTGWSEFRYTLNGFLDLPEGAFKDAVETLQMQEGNLVFSLGFLAISLKKIAEGKITEPEKAPDIGDLEPSEDDLKMTDIVGRYKVVKAPALVGDDFGAFSREEVEADIEKQIAAGTFDESERAEKLRMFEMIVEFTDDHQVIEWVKIPDGVSDEDIKAAVEAGEIGAVRDGMFTMEPKEWKAVGGKYYYNTGEHREIFGEVKSPWDELVFNEDGTLPFSEGMIVIKKI